MQEWQMIAIKFILHSRDITFVLYAKKKKEDNVTIIIKLLISFIGFVNEISGHWYSLEIRDLLTLIIILSLSCYKKIYTISSKRTASCKKENEIIFKHCAKIISIPRSN